MLANALFLCLLIQGLDKTKTIPTSDPEKVRRAGGTFRDESGADWENLGRVLARRD